WRAALLLLALLLGEPRRALGRARGGVALRRAGLGRGRRRHRREVGAQRRELVEDEAELGRVKLLERADLLLEPRDARLERLACRFLHQRISIPRCVTILGAFGSARSAPTGSPRSISRSSCSAAAPAVWRVVTTSSGSPSSRSARSRSAGDTTRTS